MFAFSSPLYWYKMVFMAELLVAEGLATYTLKKRPKFALRAVLCVLGCEALAFLCPVFDFSYNAVYTSFMFLLLFAVTLCAMKVCYDEPWVNIIFCGIIAYTTQHVAYETYNFIVTASGLQGFGVAYDSSEIEYNGFTFSVWLGAYGLIYWFVWAFVAYRIRRQENLKIDNLPLLVFSGVIIAIDIILNAIVTYSGEEISILIYTVVYIYNLLSCSLAIGMQFSMLGKRIAETELAEVQGLWDRDRKLYEMSKENVELINVKCHDLKKQIRALRTASGEVDKDALREIEQAVNIYDGAVKTGSDVLDVILAEKSLYCEKHGIKLTCIADGEKLNFMSKPDIYSLFENAISNAVEAVSGIADPDRRIARLKVTCSGRLLSVHMENCCDAAPEFEDGLPKTTKGDERWHGYGMRSMRLIAEKYGGGLSASVAGDTFNLDIILPLPQSG